MPEPARIAHEASPVSLPALAAGFGVIASAVAVSLVGAWLLLAATGTPSNAPNNAVRPAIEGPVQETNAPDTLAAYRREQAARLNGYGRDPASGAIHIPIDEAMRLQAREGKR